jgi:hypothetical protein
MVTEFWKQIFCSVAFGTWQLLYKMEFCKYFAVWRLERGSYCIKGNFANISSVAFGTWQLLYKREFCKYFAVWRLERGSYRIKWNFANILQCGVWNVAVIV